MNVIIPPTVRPVLVKLTSYDTRSLCTKSYGKIGEKFTEIAGTLILSLFKKNEDKTHVNMLTYS